MSENRDDAGNAGRGLLAIAGAKVYFIVASYAVQLALPRLFDDPAQFGLYSHVMSATSMLNNVLIAATIQSVSKFVSEHEDRGPTILRQGLKLQLWVGGLLAAALFSLAPTLSRDVFQIPQGEDLFRVASAVIFAYALYATLIGSLNGRRLFAKQARLDMTFTTLRTVGIVGGALVGIGALGSIGGFASAAVGVLLVALLAVGLGRKGEGLSLRVWASFVGPVWLYQGLLNGMLQLDIQVLARTLTELHRAAGAANPPAAALTMVGYYRGAQTFAFVPYQLVLAMTFIVFPLISRATSSGDTESARRTIRGAIRFSLLFLISIAAPIAGAADGVMRIAYPAEYLAGAPALALLVFGIAAFALFVISATVLSSAGSPGLAAAIAGVGLVIVMVATRLMIVSEGVTGDTLRAAAMGTSMGTLTALLLAAVAVYVRFGTYLMPITALRCALAGAVGYFSASMIPHDHRLMAVVALAGGFFAYLVALILLRELRRDDLDALKAILKR